MTDPTNPPPSEWQPPPDDGDGSSAGSGNGGGNGSDARWRYPPPQPYGGTGGQPGAGGAGGTVPTGYAEWWRRVVAALIDGLIVGAPLGVLSSVFGWLQIVHNADKSITYKTSAQFLLLSLVLPVLYSAIMEGGPRCASVGKMAMRIQVLDANVGGSVGQGRAALRRIVYLLLFSLYFLPGAVNALSPLWDKRRQAWHDKAARSIVVKAP